MFVTAWNDAPTPSTRSARQSQTSTHADESAAVLASAPDKAARLSSTLVILPDFGWNKAASIL